MSSVVAAAKCRYKVRASLITRTVAKQLSPTLRKARVNTRTQQVIRVSFVRAASNGCVQYVPIVLLCFKSNSISSVQGRGSKHSNANAI